MAAPTRSTSWQGYDMKKLTKLCALYFCFSFCLRAYSQSTFGFFNYVPSVGIDAPVFDAAGNRLFGSHYVAALYGGPTPDDLTVAMAGLAPMQPSPFIRTFNGQTGYFAEGGFVQIDTVPSGGYAWLQVRAWDLRLGQTYEEVMQLGLGGVGQSTLFYTYGGHLGAEGRPPQPLRGLQSFSLVPEPGTWALMALGAGVLFLKCSWGEVGNSKFQVSMTRGTPGANDE